MAPQEAINTVTAIEAKYGGSWYKFMTYCNLGIVPSNVFREYINAQKIIREEQEIINLQK